MDNSNIEDRKADHLRICVEEDVEYRHKRTLLDDVELMHDSLPELSATDVDLSISVFGKRLSAPLLIAGMTGGTEKAASINRVLARVAQTQGLAFGVGSQRATLSNPSLAATYAVRDVAPDILLFGNIGAVQAAALSTVEVRGLVESIDADALCIHLNPGQELIQPEGDRDFRGCLAAIERLVEELGVPVIVKETGCGLSARTLKKLRRAGVGWVDTSGAGGTTWIGVEALRAPPTQRDLGTLFREWGIPTAASIVYAEREDFSTVATGGIRNGLDAARAIALGASLVGMARPWLIAAMAGEAMALKFGRQLKRELTTACLLTGSQNLKELREAPRILGAELSRWLL